MSNYHLAVLPVVATISMVAGSLLTRGFDFAAIAVGVAITVAWAVVVTIDPSLG